MDRTTSKRVYHQREHAHAQTKEATIDITQSILDDHQEQRRLFGTIEQIDRRETEQLSVVWGRLATFLEVHAAAEERLFYPALLRLGKGAGGKATPEDETEDAIKDHNEIRDAIAAVKGHPVGSDAWYEAVAAANEANSDHMGEEERQGLTDFRQHADLETRHRLGIAFAVFEARNVDGVRPVDVDPKEYIADHESEPERVLPSVNVGTHSLPGNLAISGAHCNEEWNHA